MIAQSISCRKIVTVLVCKFCFMISRRGMADRRQNVRFPLLKIQRLGSGAALILGYFADKAATDRYSAIVRSAFPVH